MQFTREINRLLIICLIAFGAVGLAAAYWAVVGPTTLLRRPENPRLVEAEASIRRGSLYDRSGTLLASTESQTDTTVTRRYPYPAMNGALGYFSLRYGVGGAEAAYNALLRGDTTDRAFGETLADSLLHRPRVGSDVELTLDLNIQTRVAQAMQGKTGAVVVLSVPDGQVLALVSMPTYDPNRLDLDWDTLRAAPGNPFFNRVLQGRYQPGGTLQTPLMAAALLYNTALDVPTNGATRPVRIDDLTLTCAVRLPDVPLNLRQAYDFACPASFADLAGTLGATVVSATFDTFHLYDTPTLAGFVPATPNVTTMTPTTLTAADLEAAALGQGHLTVSPLGMAVVAAAIANDGNAPQPFALAATRAPNASAWEPVEAVRPTTPLATTAVARQLQDLMRDAVANGAAQNAGRPNIDIGGHATVSYSGEGSQAWFIGFATLGGRRGVAVAVVLENSDDPGLAADIGGTSLAAAQQALTPDVATLKPG